MKTLLLFLVMALLPMALLLSSVPCCTADQESGAAVSTAKQNTPGAEKPSRRGQVRAVVPVSGMTCGGCESALTIALKKLDGVVDAQADYRKGSVTVTTRSLTSLRESVQPLVGAFNEARERPRFLAILSPTCPACLHGAEAIRQSLLDEGGEPPFRVLVVWAPMLSSDDEDTARQASHRFEGAAVRQFYDPARKVGGLFRAEVFPHAAEKMRRSLPPGHYVADALSGRRKETPEWDIYMFFPRAQEWSSDAPRPIHWVRQVARFESPEGGLTSLMWKDSYSQPPLEGSLAEQLREIAQAARLPDEG